jgi:hypothetical protein
MSKKHDVPRLSETLSALSDEFVARLDRLHKAGDINDNAAECLGGLSEGMASLLRVMRRRETQGKRRKNAEPTNVSPDHIGGATLVQTAIEGLVEHYPELKRKSVAAAVKKAVKVPDTGNSQVDYENVRIHIEFFLNKRRK